MDCLQIVRKYLDENGFDGLYSENECACQLSDLVACANDFSECKPGYKVVPPDDIDSEFYFYICESKDDRPWEE